MISALDNRPTTPEPEPVSIDIGTKVFETNDDIQPPPDQFSLKPINERKRKVRQADDSGMTKPPELASKRAAAIVENISGMFNNAKSSEELLTTLLAMLVETGPFEKTALIVVSNDRKEAIVVAARGPNIGNGQRLSLEDSLNPLAQCFSKVQSFGAKENQVSPFGARSFAVSPINADHDTPVALYADCGTHKAMTFEARRVFRTVVEILNERLPQVPGGIPVEI